MTKEQIVEAKALIGKMPKEEIAERVGVSTVNLKRAFRGTRLAYHNKYVRQPELVKEVCAYYEKHGKAETEKRYGHRGVKVRSVVERYKHYKPRQVRWTNSQIIALVQMGGLVSFRRQALLFNRPNANEGSIKSFWMKRMGHGGGSVHGMSWHTARQIVKSDCPIVKTEWWSTRKSRKKKRGHSRKIVLWVDMEKHFKPGTPMFIRQAVRGMAKFQRRLFYPYDVKKQVRKMLAGGFE